ncbi:MAG: hypothetical protein VKP57_06655 [Candidatus Sericytochromatia bacterium]|nr:hypothetical protein [Candidatus Sericytochromatia bacterium]
MLLLGGPDAEKKERPGARRFDAEARNLVAERYVGQADGKALVVFDTLQARGYEVSLRNVQRVVEARQHELIAWHVATVRYEIASGAQMQVDFGQRFVRIDLVKSQIVV